MEVWTEINFAYPPLIGTNEGSSAHPSLCATFAWTDINWLSGSCQQFKTYASNWVSESAVALSI